MDLDAVLADVTEAPFLVAFLMTPQADGVERIQELIAVEEGKAFLVSMALSDGSSIRPPVPAAPHSRSLHCPKQWLRATTSEKLSTVILPREPSPTPHLLVCAQSSPLNPKGNTFGAVTPFFLTRNPLQTQTPNSQPLASAAKASSSSSAGTCRAAFGRPSASATSRPFAPIAL
jgi:hypothetical protein